MIKWSKKGKGKERKPPFLVFPCISLLFPRALKYGKHFLLLQAETCVKAQYKKELQTKQQ